MTVLRCVVIAVLLHAIVGVGGAAAETQWSAGPRLAVNFADLRVDGPENTDVRTAIATGLAVTAQFHELFGIRSELIFSMKGADFTTQGIDGSIKLTYLEVPVLLTLHLPVGERSQFRFFAGPALSFNLEAEAEGKVDVGFTEVTTRVGIDEYVKNTDIGTAFGGGFAFPAGSANVVLEARWTFGLKDISEDPEIIDVAQGTPFVQTGTLDIKNSVISVGVLVEFPIGRDDSVFD